MSRLRRHRRDDQGFTLAEMLVTTMLLVLVFAMATTALVATQRISAENAGRANEAADQRVAFQTLSKTVRAAGALTTTGTAFLPSTPLVGTAVPVVSGSEVWFYSYIGVQATPKPVLLRYYVQSGQLIEATRQPDAASVAPNYTYNTTTPKTRVLARNVVTPTFAKPLFTYYDVNGAEIKAGTVTASIGDTRVGAVHDVGVTLQLADPARPVKPKRSTTFTTKIRIINAANSTT